MDTEYKLIQMPFYNAIIEPFVQFCAAAAGHEIDLGLSAEQLLCLFDECLEVARYHHDHGLCIICCTYAIFQTNQLGKISDTVVYLKEMLDSSKTLGLLEIEMNTCRMMGKAYHRLNEPESAIIYLKRSIELAKPRGARQEEMDGNRHFQLVEMNTCMVIAKEYHKLNDLESAIIYLKRSVERAKSLCARQTEMGANWRLQEIYQSLNQYDNAVPCIIRFIDIAKETDDNDALANGYLSLATAYEMLKQYDEVIIYGKKCIDITTIINDKEVVMTAAYLVGNACYELNQLKDAVHYYKIGNDLAKEKGYLNLEVKSCFDLGLSYLFMKDIKQAIYYSKRCIDLSFKTGNQQDEMNACLAIGYAYQSLNQHDEAVVHLNQCINLAYYYDDNDLLLQPYQACVESYKEKNDYSNAVLAYKMCIALAKELGNKDKQMEADLLLIDLYRHFKKHEYVIIHGNECLDTVMKKEYKEFQAEIYWCLAYSYEKLHKSNDALKCYGTCIQLIKVHPPGIADTNSIFVLADQLNSLEQYDEATAYGERCYKISLKSNNETLIGKVILELADVYISQRKYGKALFYSKQAIELCATKTNGSTVQNVDGKNIVISSSKKSENRKMESRALLRAGYVYFGLCQYDTAQAYINKGLHIAEELADENLVDSFKILCDVVHHKVGTSGISHLRSRLKELGNSLYGQVLCEQVLPLIEAAKKYESKQEYELALSFYQEIEDLHEKHNLIVIYDKKNIANMNFLLGRYDTAVKHYHDILQHSKKVGNKEFEAECHFKIGRVLCLRGELTSGENSFRESIKCFETMFDFLGKNDEFKIAFVDKYIVYHETLTGILLTTNRHIEALETLDSYRARALKSQLIMNYRINQVIKEEQTQFSEIQSLVSNNNYTIVQYLAFKQWSNNVFYTLLVSCDEGKLVVHQQQNCNFEYLEKHIANAFNEMNVRHVSCEDRSLNIDEGTTDDEKVHNQDSEKEELEILLDRITERSLGFCSPSDEKELLENDDESSLNSGLEILYNKLIRNVLSDIKTEEIVFIPDGPLFKVPFAALRDPETGRYLSETKRIRIAPSISTLKILNDRPADFECKTGALIIGDPSVGNVIYDGEEKAFPSLRMAYIEALGISNVFRVEPLTQENATKAAVLERLQQGVSVVHIAAHGDAKKATILLAPSPEVKASKIPDEEDYMLTMADVQKAQVRAKLVVLSCCHSGRGEIKAEGVVGMCRAFLASGARAVVASLWAINDDAATEFMIQFYQNLKKKKSASLSLQLAMKYMRTTEEYNHPKHWAPFFLMGGDVTIF